ncbi:MAG: phospholipase [Methanocalculus sp. MSAO_Arc1]|uniref:phospholipase D-like domain-containing protein n=1 Tax=Methanocalculus TaxID=71151 RepID=UPI000FF21970|nr:MULTISPECIES: phospholipase D-like domain-containing protein [unclassified Methanocalculus]MCP1662916.1 phosphatidylserine/phosphatidylglycerophosphate/cardiolipin synthase-like enzyme [Methanocalculus sp. AMF5]RQD80376.1 MAG: phospholipase [Methanocalculus sp. MSAO_Arc1]
MHRLLLGILLLLCIPQAVCGITVTAFCPDPYLPYDPDEFIILTGQGSLDGWTITDGEGTLSFPPGTWIDGDLIIARQAEAYKITHGTYPDFEWENSTPAVPGLDHVGRFILANAADEIELYYHGELMFEVHWPRDLRPRRGQVHRYIDGVWNPRPFMIGQSDFEPIRVEDVAATLFVSPDSSYEVFEEAIRSADRSIQVSVYEFTHTGIGDLLADAHNRGVEVHILLEGIPVGGVCPDQTHLLTRLNQSGIPVDLMGSPGSGEPTRYRFMHAKYLVIDSESVILTSENLKESGIPYTGVRGNRGWGVWIHDTRVAEYFGMVFAEDSTGWDIFPITLASTRHEPAEYRVTPQQSRFAPLRIEGATVTPVISPDTSYLVPALVNEAEHSLAIQQAYIRNWTRNAPNPWLDAATGAAGRGVDVRIILDSTWYNLQGERGNDYIVGLVNTHAAETDHALEARLFDPDRGGASRIHTKGVIVDDRAVLISSINWNENSPMNNRETGVIIEHPDAAAYYMRVFEDDWSNEYTLPGDVISTDDLLKPAIAVAVILFFAGIVIGRRMKEK